MTGRTPKIFTEALKSLNSELRRKVKDKRRSFYTKDDLRQVFNEWKGRCAGCRVPLLITGRRYAARFALYVPVENGGKLTRDNLIPLCSECKVSIRPGKRPPLNKQFNFNTIPDLIEQLFKGVLENDQEKIAYFKRQINDSLGELADTLHYKPMAEVDPVIRKEEHNSAGELLTETARELEVLFKEINATKQYKVLQ